MSVKGNVLSKLRQCYDKNKNNNLLLVRKKITLEKEIKPEWLYNWNKDRTRGLHSHTLWPVNHSSSKEQLKELPVCSENLNIQQNHTSKYSIFEVTTQWKIQNFKSTYYSKSFRLVKITYETKCRDIRDQIHAIRVV